MEEYSNFIHDIIDEDIASGLAEKIHTRFPPEPNGYLHIGSAKAIWINWSTAKKYGGLFNLRFDDTNPVREDDEYVRSIIEDIRWLGAEPDGGIYYGSDYFDKCYEFAVQLIRSGDAYVCDLTPEQLREYRGTLTEPGRPSPWRERSVEENLRLFTEMREGKYAEGTHTLRAKIDMASPNMNMRDPVIYRIVFAHHHRQGDKWCIYPMYDFAHPIQDALEGITHSLCSFEFENHRPLYEWVIDHIGFAHKPKQREFARLNMTYTVMSKRYLRELVEGGYVSGWDDPRMPTLSGLRRRGFEPAAIMDFLQRAGVAKANSLVDYELLEYCVRSRLGGTATRRIAVLNPLKLTITNYPDGKVEYFTLPNNPEDPAAGTREVAFTNTLYVERDDFMENPPGKFFRLKPGGEVRLMGAYLVTCNEVVKDEAGNVTELRCTCDLETRNNMPADGRKVRGTIHWLSAAHALDGKVRAYDKLFTIPNINDIPEDENYLDYLNPDSLIEYTGCKLEPALAEASLSDRFQFVRSGYYCRDLREPEVFHRIVTLKDSWSKNMK